MSRPRAARETARSSARERRQAGSPGDVVVLYTGGIPEAEDIHGEQDGIERPVVRRVDERAATRCEALSVDVTRPIGARAIHDITTAVSERR